MTGSRERILQRIQQGLQRDPGAPSPLRPVREAAPMARPVNDAVADFSHRARSLQSTVDRVLHQRELPQAVLRYLESIGQPPVGVVWPELARLDWLEAGLTLEARPPVSADRLGITGAFCGIAETGTLLLHSGPEQFSTTSLLPETHVAVLPVDRIVARMEQAFQSLKDARGHLPRAVNFISGPSRTADIEQTIVIGAHGPRRVHIILVG